MTNNQLLEDIIETLLTDMLVDPHMEKERIYELMLQYGKYNAIRYHDEMKRTGSSNAESPTKLFNFLNQETC